MIPLPLSLPFGGNVSSPPHLPETPGRDAEDLYLQRAFRYHSRTFSLATMLLPREVRLPVAVIYLYCRTVDTLADGRVRKIGAEAALREVNRMERNLDATLTGAPPATGKNALLWRRLAEGHERFALSPEPFRQLLEGARWDLHGRPILTYDDLLAYSDLVAGSVGAMVLPLLVDPPEAACRLEPFARALGNAMQITNILRDVGEDWHDLSRTYLPREAVAAHKVDLDMLTRRPHATSATLDPSYAALVEEMMSRAESLYACAEPGIDALPRRAARGVRAAARMYREILNEVRAANYDNLTRRAVVPRRRKARLLVQDDYARRRNRLRQNHRRSGLLPLDCAAVS